MIGIIGFGRFGKLLSRYLSKDFKVFVYNRSCKETAIRDAGAQPVSFEQACRQRIIILCIPISLMRQTLKNIVPHLRREALIMDVCSVKVYPVQWMREILPDTVSILPTHPMFGPDSAAESLLDRKIVLCRERVSDPQYQRIVSYLRSKGLIVIETTPEDHDRQIALSLGLTHFIGRGLEEFGAKELIIDTEGYKRLLHILGVVTHDTWQLFEDMHHYNPYAEENRKAFITAMKTIEEKLSLSSNHKDDASFQKGRCNGWSPLENDLGPEGGD
jgi:prephenate dehydrogenase